MKKALLCFALLVVGVMNAQIVNIPDASFKAALLTTDSSIEYGIIAKDSTGTIITIDANSNGEIEVTEALAVWDLNFNYNGNTIGSLTGIGAFTNLRSLFIDLPTISVPIDLSGLINLETLYFVQIISTSVNLNGLVNLETLTVDDAPQLTTLDVSTLTALKTLTLNSYELVTLTLGNLLLLTDVHLEDVYNISTIDFSGCPALEKIKLDSLLNLNSLDLTNCNNLIEVEISTVYTLHNIFMGYQPNLEKFSYNGTGLTGGLDLSGCPAISELNLALFYDSPVNNIFLNLKNGNAEYDVFSLSGFNADTTIYICIDEGEEENFNFGNNANYYLSTYCSFTPGGDHNTITGTVSFDGDNNGCALTDAGIPFSSIQMTDGIETSTAYNVTGNYNFYTQAGTFTLTPQFENGWFTAAPETVTFATVDNSSVTQNFCVTANGVHNDVEVVIVPLGDAQPGFDTYYKIIYKNKGNQTLNGTVNFAYNDAVLDYVLASPTGTSTAGTITWNYSNLLPFESRYIILGLNVNGPMEIPAVNIDDVLPFTVSITPATGDETPDDNTFALSQTVVGSYDPNDITCLEGATVSPDKIGEYLHYNINFENTGTAPATFVVVKDIIDTAKFDVNSLVVLNASHAVEARVTGNKAEFYFDNINLAANGGKGNVTFKIKSLETLAVNSSVMQKADIFFDYNWPIVTNEATTTYALLNAPGFNKDASVKVYPNPAANLVSITANGAIQTIQLFDVQGRLLHTASVNDVNATLDITSRASGIYFVKVATENGVNVEKLIKE
jgi:Secretion system C-terminal sorting domain